MRIGHGIDVHRFVMGRPCILAGVEVPFSKGLLGHSDADVITHAVIDSILGALSWGDIGQWFPDSDEKYQGANSLELLDEVAERVLQFGYRVVNVDITVVAQEPKLAPYIPAMRANLAQILSVAVDCVSIKATTTEGLGFTGTGEGILASAQALVDTTRKDKIELDARLLPAQTLAYIGDAVYELYVRQKLVEGGLTRGRELHQAATQYVSAASQAERIRAIEAMLSEKEQAVLRRGRNSKGGVLPKNTKALDYRYSTGLEALIGYLYLSGLHQRLDEIMVALLKYDDSWERRG